MQHAPNDAPTERTIHLSGRARAMERMGTNGIWRAGRRTTGKNENPERGQAGATGFSTMRSQTAGRLTHINIDMNMMSILG